MLDETEFIVVSNAGSCCKEAAQFGVFFVMSLFARF